MNDRHDRDDTNESRDRGPRHALRALLGDIDDAEVARLLAVFRESAATQLACARAALDAGDLRTLHRSAHTLQSASAAVGATRIQGLANALSSLARDVLERAPHALSEDQRARAREWLAALERQLDELGDPRDRETCEAPEAH